MLRESFVSTTAGRLIQTPRDYLAFVPNALPPPLDIGVLAELLEQAVHAVGNLKGAGRLLPNPHMLMRPFLRREAVLSSRIEGTRASFSDLLFFEAAPEAPPPVADVAEVKRYVETVEFGLERLPTLPLSLRLCRELHEILMKGNERATPGEFRKTQNWIGAPGCTLNEAAFVPPPIDEMHACLGAWEKYLHARQGSVLIQAALLHYQFEAIHPFLDGNGRVGRLLTTLFFAERGLMPQPLLYLSAFFEKHRAAYYELLMAVSTAGRWQEWVEFFLRGVRTQAIEALRRAEALLKLQKRYKELALAQGKAGGSVAKLADQLFLTPAISVRAAQEVLGVTFRAAQLNIDRLVELGMVEEATGRERYRIYVAREVHRVTVEDMPEGETDDEAP